MMKMFTIGRVARAMIVAAVLALSSVTLAKAEVPPSSAVAPKVMLLMDTSAAMDEAVYHVDFDPNVNWSGVFTGSEVYEVGRDGSYTPRSFNSSWPNTPSIVLVESDWGNGLYRGNYLNWLFFNASPAQIMAVPQITRIQVLKYVLVHAVEMNEGIDFALTIFAGNRGGSIIVEFGADLANLTANIYGVRTDAYAPLGETTEDILDFFSYDGWDAPISNIQQQCFLVIVTGSLPTMDLDVSSYLHDADGDGNEPGTCASIGSSYPDSLDCSDYLDDVTWHMAHADLRQDLLGLQTVSTYVVSLLDENQLLRDAAENGRGQYYASSAFDLPASLDAALQDIVRRNTAPAPVPELPPMGPRLLSSHPNPFNPRTTINFELASSGPVRLDIVDLAGHVLRTLVDARMDPGPGSVVWDGLDASGRGVASGAYLVRLESGGEVVTGKLTLLR